MIKKAKRFLAGFMSICMCLTMIPVSVQANEVIQDNIQEESYDSINNKESSEAGKLITINSYIGEAGGEPGVNPSVNDFMLWDSNGNPLVVGPKIGKPGETYYIRQTFKGPSQVLDRTEVSGLDLTDDDRNNMIENIQNSTFSFVMPDNEITFDLYVVRLKAVSTYIIPDESGIKGGTIEVTGGNYNDEFFPHGWYNPYNAEVNIKAVPNFGYRFLEWDISLSGSEGPDYPIDPVLQSDFNKAEKTFKMPNKYVDLKAYFEKDPDAIFDAVFTGGEGAEGSAPENITGKESDIFTLPENSFILNGYRFQGWNDGQVVYKPGSAYTMPFGGITFTAEWTKSDSFDIKFEPAGADSGTPIVLKNQKPGDQVKIPENPFTKSGFDFDGWNDGTQTYQPGDDYTIPDHDVTFTAQWSAFYTFDTGTDVWNVSAKWCYGPEDAGIVPEEAGAKNGRMPKGNVERIYFGMSGEINQNADNYYKFEGFTINGKTYTEATTISNTDYFSGNVIISLPDKEDADGCKYGKVEFKNGEFKDNVEIRQHYTETTEKRYLANISSLAINGRTGNITNDKIVVSVPENTDLTKLKPVIKLSDGATVSPKSEEEVDLTKPVLYTVISKDGRITKKYTVSVEFIRNHLEENLPGWITQTFEARRDRDGDGTLVLGSEPFLKSASSTWSDWAAFTMGRFGTVNSDGSVNLNYKDGENNEGYSAYMEAMKANIEKRYAENDGKLDDNKVTEWHRAALAIAAIGGDVTDFGTYNGNGINLINDGAFNAVVDPSRQGINGPIFALIAMNIQDFTRPAEMKYSDEYLIKYILERQLKDGENGSYSGWALWGAVSDPDISAMAVQALSAYYWDDTEYTYTNLASGETVTKTVRTAIDEALNRLGTLQTDLGDYLSWGTRNMESTSQVLLAIISVGVDPLTDQRFIKNGNTLIDGVLRYKLKSGGFCHTFDYDPDNAGASNGVYNSMATDQGGYGLVAAWRYLNGMRYIYDFRAEFSAQDTSVINTLKTTIDNALAKKGTEGYYEALNSAMETYDSTFKELNDNSLRRYVPNYWQLSDALDAENATVDELKKAAAPVEQLIAAIGTVTKDSKAAIEKARAAYDSLADAAKKYVSNYSVLTAAEKTLAELSKPVPPEVVKVTGITLEKSGISLYPTQAQLLKATVTPANAANKAVTYKSSNTKAVTVDANGKITAKAAGTAVITVTAQDGSGKSADCKVTVKKAKVKLNAATLPLQVKKRVTLKVSGLAAGDKVVSWKSSNKKYAEVSGKGKVTAKKPGKTIITVTTKYGAKATCRINVKKSKVKVSSISVNKKKLELKKDKRVKLVVTLKPITAKDNIKFKSSNRRIATVSSSGLVKARKKGECKITVTTSNGKKATVKVKVINSSKK